MSHELVLAESVRETMAYQKAEAYNYVPPEHILHPDYLYRSSLAIGRTGSTKTTSRVAMAECRLNKSFKVVCIDIQNELEFLALACPPNHVLSNKLNNHGRKPQALRTHTLLPLGYDGNERLFQWNEIPNHWDFFCLNLFDLDPSFDWKVLMGNLSGVQEQILKTALLNVQPDWGVLDVYCECQKRYLQGDYGYPDSTKDDADSKPIPIVKGLFPKQTITTLNRKLMALNSTRFISPQLFRGRSTHYLLDWHKELLNRKTVTVLKVGLLPTKLQHAVVNYILRKTFLMAQHRNNDISDPNYFPLPPIAFIIPEITDYAPEHIPDDKKETLPPLRDTILEIYRKGRRHQIVFDVDSADFSNVPNEIKEQTWYYFVFDSDIEVLNDCIRRTGVLNAETLRGRYDNLKEKGSYIYLQKFFERGWFSRDLIPSCWIPREGENFLEVWRNLYPNKFKSVDPYYNSINLIHSDMKKRVHETFKRLEEQVELQRKTPLTENVEQFCQYIASQIEKTGNTEFSLNTIINGYRLSSKDKISKVTLYSYIEKLQESSICTVVKTTKPYTLKVNLEKLKNSLTIKKETVEG